MGAAFITKNPPDDTGIGIAGEDPHEGRKLSREERRQSMLRKQVEAEQESGIESWASEDEAFLVKHKKDKKVKKEKKEKKDKKEKKEKKVKNEEFGSSDEDDIKERDADKV